MHIHCTHKRALTLLCALALIFLLPGTSLGVSGWGNAPERNTNSNTEPHSGQRTTEDSQSKSESGTVDETTIPVPGSGSKAPKAAEADAAQAQPGRSSERVLESKSTSESERRTDTERKETIIVPEDRRQNAAQPQEGPAQGGNGEKERITRESTNSEKDKASLREETRIIAPEQAGPETQNQEARQSEEQQKEITEERRQADREEKTRQEERTVVLPPAEAGRAEGSARGKGVYLRELIPLTRMPPKDNGEAAPEEAKADGSAQPAERPAQPGEEKEAAKLEDTRKKAVPSEAGQKEAKGHIEKAKAERAREEPEQTKAEKGKTEKAPAQPEPAGAERGKAERKNARPKIGEPLRIPPEAVKTGNLDFLEGCWQGTRPEYYSKRTVEECFCFGPGGQTGKRRIIDPAGGRSCIGATRANLNKNGVLSVTSQKGYCDDGVNWGQAEMLCHGEGQSTPCSWVFRDAQGGRQAYRIPFVRVRACGR